MNSFNIGAEVISGIRNIRKSKQIPNKESLSLYIKINDEFDKSIDTLITKMSNIDQIEYVDDKVDGAFSFRVGSNEFFVPLAQSLDIEDELLKLNQELDYTKGFLNSVNKKLSNQRFVDNAPEQVVAMEKKKQSDAQTKINMLENQIKSFS